MQRSQSRRPRRLITTIVTALLGAGLVIVPAMPASADTSGAIDRVLNGLNTNINPGGGSYWQIATPWRVRTADNQTFVAYCVEMPIGTGIGVPYTESDWSGIPNLANAGWITLNSAPQVSYEDLTDAVEAHSGIVVSPDYTEYEAQGITQFAIWHYTDGFEFSYILEAYSQTGNGASFGPKLDLPRLQLLFDYLTDPAINVGITEPTSSLSLDNSTATRTGNRYGPVTVTTSAPSVDLAISGTAGAQLVNAAGAAITTAANGAELYVVIPDDATAGAATITANAPDATMSFGRLLRSPGQQTILAATSATAASAAEVNFDWTAQLPSTGAEHLELVLPVATALSTIGLLLAFAGRARRTSRARHSR